MFVFILREPSLYIIKTHIPNYFFNSRFVSDNNQQPVLNFDKFDVWNMTWLVVWVGGGQK